MEHFMGDLVLPPARPAALSTATWRAHTRRNDSPIWDLIYKRFHRL